MATTTPALAAGDVPEWVTFARVEAPCETVLIEGHFDAGEVVPCPDCGDEHVLREVTYIEVVPSIQIGDTIHLFPRR